MRKSLAAVLCFLLLCEAVPLWAGLGSDKAQYVGGTVSAIKDGSEGTASTKNEKAFVFNYDGGKLEVPYDHINDLEYGQKAGRRV